MFWRMTGLSATSPVDAILDKENYTLDELLDEDDIIQECKALNTRLINFLREKAQVEQLLRLIVDEVTEDAEKKRVFKFPFIACEIFTCEVDIILRTLVEDEELINLLFSFLKPDRSHSPLQAGYFSKVVVCLMLRKTLPLINYVQKHPEIVNQLVDLIGITSIMEVLIRLIGADETMYANYADAMQWLDETNVLEMIVEKFGSSDSPEVHANAAEVLCAVTRYAPPSLASKICSPSFVGRLFHHAFEPSRPRSVLVHSLSVCISLLDPKRLVTSSYQAFRSQLTHGTLVTASPETVNGMLESLGELLKLLDISSAETPLPTTYGILQPPLGKHRLKIVEFISVLLSIGSEEAEAKLVNLGAIKRVIDLFFEYPYNNFLHHFVENIITSCLESRQALLIEHLLNECNLVGRILETENHPTLSVDSSKPTKPTEGRTPPKVGNIGHITRIANKLIQLANNNTTIQSHLQENNNWAEWQKDVLAKRNAIENVYQWACGRPTSLQDRGRDSDEEDFRDRDYDVAALASNLSQAFRYGIYTDNDIDEAQSAERDDEDPYFDDESAEVVISSLRLGGENQDSGSLFTNSNWFAFDDNAAVTDSSISSIPSSSPSSDDSTEEKAMIGETSETTTGPNRNRDLEASIEGDEEEDDDDGPTIVLGNGPIEPPSISAANTAGLNSSPMDIPSSVETDAAQAGEDVLPVKDEKDDVEIVEKEVIMETPVADTGSSEPNQEMERLVTETSTAEPKAEVEIPVAETVITEVKTEVETPVPEIGISEPNKQKETLVAETGSAEPKEEVEIPVAETVVTEVKTEVDTPVAETGVTEPKTEESEDVQK